MIQKGFESRNNNALMLGPARQLVIGKTVHVAQYCLFVTAVQFNASTDTPHLGGMNRRRDPGPSQAPNKHPSDFTSSHEPLANR
jgi:hypothetical protein